METLSGDRLSPIKIGFVFLLWALGSNSPKDLEVVRAGRGLQLRRISIFLLADSLGTLMKEFYAWERSRPMARLGSGIFGGLNFLASSVSTQMTPFLVAGPTPSLLVPLP